MRVRFSFEKSLESSFLVPALKPISCLNQGTLTKMSAVLTSQPQKNPGEK